MARFTAMAALVLAAYGHGHSKTSMLVDYIADGNEMQGYMTYKSSMCTSTNKCPAVIIIQDWTGMDAYEKERACMLADMGYVAFAADIYGVNTPKATFQDWSAASTMHRDNATKYMNKIHGAISEVMTYDFVDTDKMAAIGYCFGGTGLINIAMTGYAGFPGITFPSGLLGLVSFHGGLSEGYESPVISGSRPKLMVHSGALDDANGDIETLTDDLESVSATYEINRYGADVVHSFTDWDANTPGFVYSPFADQRSWEATTQFFQELFSTGVDPVAEPNVTTAHADFTHMDVSYMADGSDMLGWMIYNASLCTSSSKCPVVVVIQDWTGMDDYEKERSYLLAQEGYVAFAADIYGVDTPKADMDDWIMASSAHRDNATKYMNKIHGAIMQAMTYDFVDTGNMAAIGYCFGGTGLINLAMLGYAGSPSVEFPTGLKGVVSFHGGLSSGYAAPVGGMRPKVLIHSGAQDDSNADISTLTDDLEGLNASYEISRYGSNVVHAFTEWGAPGGFTAYDARADFRSWQDTLLFFHELFTGGTVSGTHPDDSFMCDMLTSTSTQSADAADTASAAYKAGMGTTQFVASCVLALASLLWGL